MNKLNPIYTEETECRDCYKCVRHCPVKAIKIKDGSAQVDSDLCILCGNCIAVCPVGAKKIRDDLSRAKKLLKKKKEVVVSLAPSFTSEFRNLEPSNLVKSLKRLGFGKVSETALGAEIVTTQTAESLNKFDELINISSACPVIVELIEKYYPHLVKDISKFLSPVQAHAKLLRKITNQDIGIVFISPCIAKKREAERYPGLIDVAITFEDLHHWFMEESINPYTEETADDEFFPFRANAGALYPVDGGMCKTIERKYTSKDIHFMSVSGKKQIVNTISGLEQNDIKKKIFIEMLACNGGCINGPKAETKNNNAIKRLDIFDYLDLKEFSKITHSLDISREFEKAISAKQKYTEKEINKALKQIGKVNKDDELNCGGCGYNTCREFAEAYLNGYAEQSMCVSYMRKLAMNKANALLKAMPSGVVIVDEKLKIVECNKRFINIIGGDAKIVAEANPNLSGAFLNKLVPFHKDFSRLLNQSKEIIEKDIHHKQKILRLLVFPIEKGRIAGGIIQDITKPSVRREQIIDKAQQVIKKNLNTVQKIAFLLGENAAESEVILNSIIESFSLEKEA